ncbi:hypothetical protein [Nakamurella lactea]|uniref:hypothetical protein n=1 Tax=Nakamurella lactea TaxID=459515 RepID=UPI000422FD97|nr:hypothetical protein [Nakamurella lactea]
MTTAVAGTFSRTPATTRHQAGPIDRAAALLARHSIDVLRVCVGLVLLGFGVLKFFPGVSPVEALVTRTVDAITFGTVTGTTAMVATAGIECCVGLMLVTKVLLRTGLVLLAGCVIGFMCPLVLFFSDMFPGGHPTLEAQYMIKDVVLAAAGLVVMAKALGARLTTAADSDVQRASVRTASAK